MTGTPFLVVWLAALVSISSQTGWKALYELEPEAVAAILNPGPSEAPSRLAEQRAQSDLYSNSGPHTSAHAGSTSAETFPFQHTGWNPQHTADSLTFPYGQHGQPQHTSGVPRPMARFTVPHGENGQPRHTIWGSPVKNEQPSFDQLSEITDDDPHRRFHRTVRPIGGQPATLYAEYGVRPYHHTDWNSQPVARQHAASFAGQVRQGLVNRSPQPATIQDMNSYTRDGHNIHSAGSQPSTIPPLQVQSVAALGLEQAEALSSFGLRSDAVMRQSQQLTYNGLLAPLSISERKEILTEVVEYLSARHTRMRFRTSAYGGREVTLDLLRDIYPWGRYKFHKLNGYTFLSNHHSDAGFENTDIEGRMSGTQDASKRIYVWLRLSVKHQDAFVYRLVGLIETSGQAITATGVLPSVGGVSCFNVRTHGEDSVADSSRIREV